MGGLEEVEGAPLLAGVLADADPKQFAVQYAVP
jgi:hypothetical protein